MHDYDVFFMHDVPDMVKRFIFNDDMVNIWKDTKINSQFDSVVFFNISNDITSSNI